MKKLQFDSLLIENFRSFLAPQTFVFGEEGSSGLYFLRGRNTLEPRLGANGAGKSSVFMALCWVLYGRTPDNLRGPDIKPWKGKGTPTVELVVYVNDERHEVRRQAKTNGLRIDGVEAGPDEPAELIGLSFDTFVNTLLYPQQLPLFFDRSPSEKMQLFSDVLKLERWEERSEAASKKVRELEDLQREVEGELLGTAAALAQTKELLEGARARSEQWVKDQQALVKQLTDDLAEKEKRLKKITKLVDDADLAYDAACTEEKALSARVRELQVKLREAQREDAVAGHAWEQAADALESFGTAKTCPSCGQSIKGLPASHRKELVREEALRKKAAEAAGAAVDAASKALTQAEEHQDAFREKARAARAVLDLQRPAQAALKAEIAAVRSATDGEARNPHSENVAALRRKFAQQEKLVAELEDDLKKASRQVERHRFWVKGFKDVKLYLIQEVLEELQLVSNLMLSEVGLEGWKLEYAVEKEAKTGNVKRGINITITPAYASGEKAASVKWEAWSGGEGQRLRIIGALALSEVLLNYAGVSTDLECLDEPTRHLSAQGAEDLCSFLQERAKRLKRNIWLVDHLAHETSKFAGGMLVTKSAKGSMLSSW